MGYPHPSHPKETPVLSKYFGDAEARTFDGWVKRGGYEGLRKALAMGPEAVIEVECLGACGFATPVMVNEEFLESVTPATVPDVLARFN